MPRLTSVAESLDIQIPAVSEMTDFEPLEEGLSMTEMEDKEDEEWLTLSVEVCLMSNAAQQALDELPLYLKTYLPMRYAFLSSGTRLNSDSFKHDKFLKKNVDFIQICETLPIKKRILDLRFTTLDIFLFHWATPFESPDLTKPKTLLSASSEEEEKVVTLVEHTLPSEQYFGLWESLVFDDNLQYDLLDYIHTALLFSDCDIDPSVISVNRLILLHGPPGTGKTTLCKALAQVHNTQISDKAPETC
jgi:SpoVK/Ycf46/Vps4 family AAA+-type ATPase